MEKNNHEVESCKTLQEIFFNIYNQSRYAQSQRLYNEEDVTRFGFFVVLLFAAYIWFPFKVVLLDNLYLPTPPLGQDMTQGQFLSGV